MPRLPDQDTRSTILDQAEQLFLSRGFMETSMAEIAEACGLTKPALYHHFRDKNQIYLDVLTRGLQSIAEQSQEIMARPVSLKRRLVDLGQELAANPHSDYEISQRNLRQHFKPDEQTEMSHLFLRSLISPLAQTFGSEIEAGRMRAGKSVTMVFAFLSLVAMVRNMRRSAVPIPVEQTMEEVVSLLLPDGA